MPEKVRSQWLRLLYPSDPTHWDRRRTCRRTRQRRLVDLPCRATNRLPQPRRVLLHPSLCRSAPALGRWRELGQQARLLCLSAKTPCPQAIRHHQRHDPGHRRSPIEVRCHRHPSAATRRRPGCTAARPLARVVRAMHPHRDETRFRRLNAVARLWYPLTRTMRTTRPPLQRRDLHQWPHDCWRSTLTAPRRTGDRHSSRLTLRSRLLTR